MDLVSALKPLRVGSQIMGLNVGGWLGRAYTFAVLFVVTSLTYPSYIDLVSYDDDVLTGVDSLIHWTQLVGNIIFVLVVLGVCLCRPRLFRFPIERIRQIDAVFRFFGVKMNDKYFYRLQSIQIFVSLIIWALLTWSDIDRLIQENSIMIFFHWLHYSYAVVLSMMVDCLFVDYLAVIDERFFKLNQLLREISARDKHPTFNLALLYVGERKDPRKQNTSTASDIERLRILHHDLCSLSKKVNGAFGLQQLVSTAISLIMITGQLYEAYHFIMVNNNPVEIGVQKIMWIIFYVGRLFHVSYACSRTSSEASVTSSIIHEVAVQQVSSGVSSQIQNFSLQLLHENLNFNACGFFKIDFTLLCSIVGVVSTYLVIFIQMDRKTQCVPVLPITSDTLNELQGE